MKSVEPGGLSDAFHDRSFDVKAKSGVTPSGLDRPLPK
jgi:hypothetical protein